MLNKAFWINGFEYFLLRLFLVRCTSCALPIRPPDMIQRAGANIYHSGCFACSFCGKQFHPGDEYLHQENQILCRLDFENFFQSSYSNAFQINPFPHNVQRKALKRPRTILTSQQRKTFKASFEVSAKPCRKVREALAKETGLSVRVVQVWFQNQRAKMKKIHRKTEGKRSCSEETPDSEGQMGQTGKEKTSSKDYTSSSLSDFESISESHSCPHLLGMYIYGLNTLLTMPWKTGLAFTCPFQIHRPVMLRRKASKTRRSRWNAERALKNLKNAKGLARLLKVCLRNQVLLIACILCKAPISLIEDSISYSLSNSRVLFSSIIFNL
ncbi:homeobox domain protein [Trichuris suis]|nr:homeobox domain protein [Trichuris suis]